MEKRTVLAWLKRVFHREPHNYKVKQRKKDARRPCQSPKSTRRRRPGASYGYEDFNNSCNYGNYHDGNTNRSPLVTDFTVLFNISVSTTIIYYVTTRRNGNRGENRGGTNGGTELWIRGGGFVPNAFTGLSVSSTNYEVKLVNYYTIYDCDVDANEITDTRLLCYTVAMPEGTYLARVYVNDNLISLDQYTRQDDAKFLSLQGYTPM
ncbi:unnamed protein product, partial [Adineta ricciae]